MTARDFTIIAIAIKSYSSNRAERYNLAQHFASILAETNPFFDRARFFAACGV